MNKEITCCGSTMVLGKWLPCEHIGVRHTWCRSTMVLDKWLPYEHIGVRHDVVGKKIDDLTLPYFWGGKEFLDSSEEAWEGNHERVMISISRPRQSLTSRRQDTIWCHWGDNFWLAVKRESNLSHKSTWELVKEIKGEFDK